MQKSYFPGYNKCSVCNDLISFNDQNHSLKCRGRSLVEKKQCPLCNHQFDIDEFQDHIAVCNEESTSSSSPISSSSSKKQCPICDQFVDDLASHCQLCANSHHNETDNSGYATPRGDSPIAHNKQTKECVICSETIDQSHYEEHVASCSSEKITSSSRPLINTDQNNKPRNPNEKPNNSTSKIDKNISRELMNSKTKQTVDCPLCSQSFNQSEYGNHVLSCSYSSQSSVDRQNTDNTTQKGSNHLNKKQCAVCEQFIDQLDFADHVAYCPEGPSANTSQRNQSKMNTDERQNQRNPPKYSLKNKQTKECALCSRSIDESEYGEHVASCSNEQLTKTSRRDQSNIDTNQRQTLIDKRNSPKYSSQSKQTKECALCSKLIDESEYGEHVASCSDEQSTRKTRMNTKQRKECGICSQLIDESEYRDHVATCSGESSSNNNRLNRNTTQRQSSAGKRNPTKNKQTKECALCSRSIDESEYGEHVASCSDEQSTRKTRTNTKQRKECGLCSQLIDESEYRDHVATCSDESSSNKSQRHQPISNVKNTDGDKNRLRYSPQEKQTKQCVLCLKSIDESEYTEHLSTCLPEPSTPNGTVRNDKRTTTHRKDSMGSASATAKSTKDCILCFRPIEQSEYENHVLACVSQTENQSGTSSRRKNENCLTCQRPINKEVDLFREIPCHSSHKHCLLCLQRSMDEFARNRSPPVCHIKLCDYELSRHDISTIPLERRLSDRLLKLCKGQQRPQCSKCHFYINITETEDFDQHVESCGDLIPCEYCQLPYSMNQLEIHGRHCRQDKSSKNEKLANFVVTRTRYPFTIEQIRFFILQQSKNSRNSLDPHSVIDALAVFGPIFPFDMPTRDCDVCMEARPYDDIYVFDCNDSHKLCYECYYRSCQTKMANGEILTCGLCTNPLRDGELNQLRVPGEELRKIREYQMKKTFDVYSSRTRGVIKCPKQNCTWVAEAEDPNERFKVKCDICKNEFCSLCNQQYHYRTTCQQLPQITQRWFFWCQTERNRYLTMRAQQDATYAAQLADFNKKNAENETRNRDLRRRYDDLMNDEQYKAQNCRLCPSCKRVVQRLEGCDSMVCGQDAHGGNVQSGCGTKFNWAQAQPYAAAAAPQPRQQTIELPKPENPIVHHNGVKCDQCQNDVNGIRFDCVHCPALTYCEKCEQQSTLNHSRQNQNSGQQQHVFKLIMTPQDEASY